MACPASSSDLEGLRLNEKRHTLCIEQHDRIKVYNLRLAWDAVDAWRPMKELLASGDGQQDAASQFEDHPY